MNISEIFLKEASHWKVFNLIRINKSISGADLSRLTGLGRSMIVYILRALQEKDLIQKCGIGESTSKGGKKPTLWKLNHKLAILIGAEVLRDKIRFIAIDFDGEIKVKQTHFYTKHTGFNLIKIIEEKYYLFLSGNNIKKEKIIGFSIALAGLVDRVKGALSYSTTLEVSDLLLTDVLSAKLKTKIHIINDANAGAMGVKWFPEKTSKKDSSIIYITYNKSAKNLGCGIIINDELYEGASQTAGEVFFPLPSIESLLKEGINKYGANHKIYDIFMDNPKIEIKDIYNEMSLGCPLSFFVLEKISDFISNEIVRIIGFINPSHIVIGGDIALEESTLVNIIKYKVDIKIKKTLDNRVLMPKIKFSHHGIYSVAMGAIASIYQGLMMNSNID